MAMYQAWSQDRSLPRNYYSLDILAGQDALLAVIFLCNGRFVGAGRGLRYREGSKVETKGKPCGPTKPSCSMSLLKARWPLPGVVSW